MWSTPIGNGGRSGILLIVLRFQNAPCQVALFISSHKLWIIIKFHTNLGRRLDPFEEIDSRSSASVFTRFRRYFPSLIPRIFFAWLDWLRRCDSFSSSSSQQVPFSMSGWEENVSEEEIRDGTERTVKQRWEEKGKMWWVGTCIVGR